MTSYLQIQQHQLRENQRKFQTEKQHTAHVSPQNVNSVIVNPIIENISPTSSHKCQCVRGCAVCKFGCGSEAAFTRNQGEESQTADSGRCCDEARLLCGGAVACCSGKRGECCYEKDHARKTQEYVAAQLDLCSGGHLPAVPARRGECDEGWGSWIAGDGRLLHSPCVTVHETLLGQRVLECR